MLRVMSYYACVALLQLKSMHSMYCIFPCISVLYTHIES